MDVRDFVKKYEALYPFKSNYLDIDGKNHMHYIDEGKGDVVIMLHGNPTWSFYYRNVAHALKDRYRVIVPDHIGCGLSDKPQDYNYTLEQRINDVEKLIRFLDIDKFHLIVHDWGGAIGMGLATRNELMVEKIVILNTAAFRSKVMAFGISLCKNKFFGEFLVRTLNGFSYPATFMSTVKKLPKVIKQAYLAPHNNYKNRKSVYEFVKDIPLDDSHQSYKTLEEIEEKLPSLIGEKLILWGGKDFCFNDSFFARWREIYPDANYKYFKDAGHYVLEDKKEECISYIAKFLEQDA